MTGTVEGRIPICQVHTVRDGMHASGKLLLTVTNYLDEGGDCQLRYHRSATSTAKTTEWSQHAFQVGLECTSESFSTHLSWEESSYQMIPTSPQEKVTAFYWIECTDCSLSSPVALLAFGYRFFKCRKGKRKKEWRKRTKKLKHFTYSALSCPRFLGILRSLRDVLFGYLEVLNVLKFEL